MGVKMFQHQGNVSEKVKNKKGVLMIQTEDCLELKST